MDKEKDAFSSGSEHFKKKVAEDFYRDLMDTAKKKKNSGKEKNQEEKKPKLSEKEDADDIQN